GLVEQWRDELERKFSLPTAILTGRSGVPDCRGGGPVVLASLAAARRDPLKGELTGGGWDLVVADEAHRLRAAHSAAGRLLRMPMSGPSTWSWSSGSGFTRGTRRPRAGWHCVR